MDIQRLRNLSTGLLHTEIDHALEDITKITGINVLLRQFQVVRLAILPYLRSIVSDNQFFERKYDPNHVGEIEILPMNDKEREDMLIRYTDIRKSIMSLKTSDNWSNDRV